MYKYLLTILILPLLVSCSHLTSLNKAIFGKNSQKQTKIEQKFQDIEQQTLTQKEERLTHIGSLSAGVDYALSKTTNQEPATDIARQVNQRVQELANKPDSAELRSIYLMINILLTNKVAGEKLLTEKDKYINQLNQESKNIQIAKNALIAQAKAQAMASANEADQYKATLSKLDGNGGINAIIYGFKKLIIRCAWILGIGTVLFIVLRIFAASNPIAGAIFSIFNVVFSWGINIIKSLAPQAAHLAGFVESSVNNTYKSVLTKIVDAVEIVQDRATAAKTDAKVSDVLSELTQSRMSNEEQSIIDNIKKSLNWK